MKYTLPAFILTCCYCIVLISSDIIATTTCENSTCLVTSADALDTSTSSAATTAAAAAAAAAASTIAATFTVNKGAIIIAPSGLKLTLLKKIGILGEESPECHAISRSSEMVLRSKFNQGKVEKGLLLPPTKTSQKHPMLLPPPASFRPLESPKYFTGLDMAVFSPIPLATRIEEKRPRSRRFPARYKVDTKQHGKGSCGEVWKAKSTVKNEFFILKRMFVHRGVHVWYSGWREIFFGRLLRGLPNVARFVEYFETKNEEKDVELGKSTAGELESDLWLVFRDEGESLRNFLYSQIGASAIVEPSPEWVKLKLNSGRDTFKVIHDIMFNILQGLHQIHTRGVTHRDIKPSNIVVQQAHSSREQTILKLVDFGSSIVFLANSSEPNNMYPNGATTFDMTEKYMPLDLRIRTLLLEEDKIEVPIIIIPNALTTAIDLWSTGVLLLEMLLGTDEPFTIDGRLRAKIEQKIRKAKKSTKEGAVTIPTTQLVDAVALATAAMEFCVLPAATLNEEFDQILPFLDLSVADDSTACEDSVIFESLKRRDSLHVGLSLFHKNEAKRIIQLLRGLLVFDPQQRITASEALALPLFKHSKTYIYKNFT